MSSHRVGEPTPTKERAMQIRVKDGREFGGSAVQIVQQMRSIAFGRDGQPLGEYVDWVQQQTREFEGIDLNIRGEHAEEKAESLVDELLRTGLAARI
jgi:hypothetical protein